LSHRKAVTHDIKFILSTIKLDERLFPHPQASAAVSFEFLNPKAEKILSAYAEECEFKVFDGFRSIIEHRGYGHISLFQHKRTRNWNSGKSIRIAIPISNTCHHFQFQF
jgi:hypothetical protein